jgi:hypothetical protein
LLVRSTNSSSDHKSKRFGSELRRVVEGSTREMLDDGTTIWAKRLNKLTLSGKVLMMVVGGVVEAEFCVTDFGRFEPPVGLG